MNVFTFIGSSKVTRRLKTEPVVLFGVVERMVGPTMANWAS
jgi:hypothetical protein